jgi:hypothetical protein
MELKEFRVRFIKIGRRFAQIIFIKAESEAQALKKAEEQLGAQYGVISATSLEDEPVVEPELVPGVKSDPSN